MPHFAYKARDARGQLVEGVLEGVDSGAVATVLFGNGLVNGAGRSGGRWRPCAASITWRAV